VSGFGSAGPWETSRLSIGCGGGGPIENNGFISWGGGPTGGGPWAGGRASPKIWLNGT
jgi:hypothetical protein